MSLLSNAIAIPQKGGYNLTDSVRFRATTTPSLQRSFSSAATNSKKGTISVWVKRNRTGSVRDYIIQTGTGTGNDNYFSLFFTNSGPDSLKVGQYSVNAYVNDTRFYRDPSAWYHIVVAFDSTLGTAADRCKIWVNGELTTNVSGGAGSNSNFACTNSGQTIYIGYWTTYAPDYYLSEFHLVDGQALTASDFGEYDNTTGVWKPKKYTGTYGNNGFYLPMKATTQASGFNTVLYTGTGTDNLKVDGVGFSPDFVWIKSRDGARSHMLYDTVRGATNRLASESTTSELSISDGLKSFDTNGFTLGTHANNNTNGEKNVAWCWEAGGTASSNTNGTITSNVSANTAKGFSIVTYTGTGVAGTIGHGLGSAPEMIILKGRDANAGYDDWYVYHSSLGNGNKIFLNLTDASSATSVWDNTSPTNDVFSVRANTINTSGIDMVAYCFSEVAGFSKFGSYTGNGSTTGPTVTTGFRPAWIMFKRTDSTQNWIMFDNTRDVDGTLSAHLYADLTNAEASADTVSINDTGFQIISTGGTVNTSGGTYIYMAFADTRDAQFNFDASGNKNNFTPVNINSNASSETSYDIMSDVPTLTDEDTGNFCTINSVTPYANATFTEGNLKAEGTDKSAFGTFLIPEEGKWYWEVYINSGNTIGVGVIKADTTASQGSLIGTTDHRLYYGNTGNAVGTTNSAYGATFTTGDLIGVALDMDAGTMVFYKNGSSQGTAFTDMLSIGYRWVPKIGLLNSTVSAIFNFGQRPFAYTPPTGYKKLNTYNLPDSTIVKGNEYFDTSLYQGTGSTQVITNSGFSPDLVWQKPRNESASHRLVDSVRGVNKVIYANQTAGESTETNTLTSFNSNGFTGGGSNAVSSGYNAVAWQWRGSDSSPVSNTDGGRTSLVSANTTSGFSVCTYTGNGSTTSFGHGLGVAPDMVIAKSLDASYAYPQWYVYHRSLGGGYVIMLNLTDDPISTSAYWGSNPDSSKVYIGSDIYGPNVSGDDYVAYCFAPVEGFSKFGKYIGNGSTNGPFVYTGFRPAFVLTRCYTTPGNWMITDTARNKYNLADLIIMTNNLDIEYSQDGIDILSNGFKMRKSTANRNQSGQSFLYAAFAENPFKNSLAR